MTIHDPFGISRASAVEISRHAIKRSQQRGIPRVAMMALVEYGKHSFTKKGISCSMDRQTRIRARRAMGELAYKRVERWLEGCYVVMSLDLASVITAAWRNRRRRQ